MQLLAGNSQQIGAVLEVHAAAVCRQRDIVHAVSGRVVVDADVAVVAAHRQPVCHAETKKEGRKEGRKVLRFDWWCGAMACRAQLV